MTSSYYAARGRAADMPPDISSTNYMQTEADMVKPVNEEIDRVQDSYDAYFEGLINSYNHEFKKQTPLEQSIGAINSINKFIKVDKKRIDNWLEFQKKYNKFYDLRFGKDAKARLEAIGPNWFDRDPDVLKYRKVYHLMNEQQRENYAAAKELLINEKYKEARELFNGLNDVFKDNIDDDKTALQLGAQHETIYRPKAEAGMKVWLGEENGFHGSKYNRYFTYDEVIHDERARLYIDRTIDSYFAFRHENLFRGRLGKFKYEFVKPLLDRTDTRNLTVHKAQGAALQDINRESRAKDIEQRIQIDPGYIVSAINIYSGQFAPLKPGESHDLSALDPAQREGLSLAVVDTYDTLIRTVENNPAAIPHILKARKHKFKAFDGHVTTPAKLWKKHDRRLMAAINKAQEAEANNFLEEKEAEDNALVESLIAESDKRQVPWTAQERYNKITKYMRDAGITDPQKVPDRIKDIAYGGMELDEEIDYRLTRRSERGEEITQADIRGISDPIMLDKWKKAISSNAGFSLPTKSHQLASQDIKAIIAKRLGDDIQKVQGNPLFQPNFEGGFQVYLARYRELKRAQPGISDQAAHNGALEAARVAINTPVVTADGTKTGDFIFDKRVGGLDQNLKEDVQSTREQIKGQPVSNTILSPTPLKGEDQHLLAAAQYIQSTSQGLPGVLPSYYRMISKGLPGEYKNPEILMRTRLKATGLLKGETNLTIPEFENLPKDKAIELTVKPTSCKTYMQMQNMTSKEEDLNWMLDTVKDPTAMNEGGYDYVVSPNVDGDKDAHLPKPLTQHTVGEVVELARSGHSDFGAYGITAGGLISIVEANQVPLDIPFDQNTQDLFVLGRLRQKAQQAQSLSTQQSAYRRLVNIRPEDNEKFLEIVGDLPPFLQLSNMIAICSTELVNQTLQR